MIVVSALMLPVMIVRFYMGWLQMVFLDVPLIVASFWSISAFYVIAQRELYPKNWKRSFFMLPMLMAVGVALTIINTRAVLEALFGVETSFVRTPKYAIEGTQPVRRTSQKKYRRRSGWLPYAELLFGTYFLGMVIFAIAERKLTCPSRSLACSWAAITGRGSRHCTRNIRNAFSSCVSVSWNCRPLDDGTHRDHGSRRLRCGSVRWRAAPPS